MCVCTHMNIVLPTSAVEYIQRITVVNPACFLEGTNTRAGFPVLACWTITAYVGFATARILASKFLISIPWIWISRVTRPTSGEIEETMRSGTNPFAKILSISQWSRSEMIFMLLLVWLVVALHSWHDYIYPPIKRSSSTIKGSHIIHIIHAFFDSTRILKSLNKSNI